MSEVNIENIKVLYRTPDYERFTKSELAMFDADGFSRYYLKIRVKDVNDAYMTGLRDIIRLQYNLPMKYLKPVPGMFSYVSQKSLIQGKEKDINLASVTIEPLNCDFNNVMQYTPINQSLPIGTIVTINESIPFDTLQDGSEPVRKLLWSNCLKCESDIKDVIKKKNPNSVRLEPWMKCCHYGAIDIGSKITGKYIVSYVDTSIIKSFALFGFKRSDVDREFVLWCFKCYNITPKDILESMLKHDSIGKHGKELVNTILKVYPTELCKYEKVFEWK